MPSSTTTVPAEVGARFLLVGDSHAGPIGRAARAARIPFVGGPIGSGREFFEDFFAAEDDGLLFRDEDASGRFKGFLDELNAACLADVAVPMVSTFGSSVHFVATRQNWTHYRDEAGYPADFLAGPLFEDVVATMCGPALDFYRHVLALGLRVLIVLPPQRVPSHADPVIFRAAQHVVAQRIARLGVEIVDLRDRVTDETGFQRRELCEVGDEIHGNLAWGRIVLAELLDRGL